MYLVERSEIFGIQTPASLQTFFTIDISQGLTTVLSTLSLGINKTILPKIEAFRSPHINFFSIIKVAKIYECYNKYYGQWPDVTHSYLFYVIPFGVHFCYHHDQSLRFARSTRLGMHNYQMKDLSPSRLYKTLSARLDTIGWISFNVFWRC